MAILKFLSSIIKEIINLIKSTFLESQYKHPPKEWAIGRKGSILLINGLNSSYRSLRHIANILNAHGYKIFVAGNIDTNISISLTASKFRKFILDNKLKNLIILSHSKGGFIAKYLIDNYSEINSRVKNVVSLNTPFGGIPKYVQLILPKQKEIFKNSKFIETLNTKTSNNHKFINFYSWIDESSLESKDFIVPEASNEKVDIIGHENILHSKKLAKKLLSHLQ